MNDMENVPYLAIIIAAVVHFIIGMLWCSPLLFGNVWMKLIGLTQKDIEEAKKKGMVGTMVIGFVSSVVTAAVIWFLLDKTGMSGVNGGALFGGIAWLGFNASVIVGTVLWEGRPFKLYLLNTGYWLVSFVAMGVVIGVM